MAVTKLLTDNHSIHSMGSHAVQTSLGIGSQNIILYSTTEYNGATVTMHVHDGTNHERIIIEIGNFGNSIGIDDTRILITGSMLDLTFSTAVVNNQLRLTVNNSDTVSTTTIKYYVISNSL